MAATCLEVEDPTAARSKAERSSVLTIFRDNGHYFFSFLLAAAVVPAFHAAGLQLSINWQGLIPAYWEGLAAHSTLAAVILAVVGLPSLVTFRPVWSRFAAQKARLLIFAPFVAWAFWKFGIHLALVWIAIALVSTELYDRSKGNLLIVARRLGAAVIPAMYLFGGLILVFAYNDAIAAVKDPSGYDWVFLKADSYLLHGNTVSNLVHTASAKLSPRVFAFAETMYYRMFDQVGAAILLISACQGMKRGLRLVGTILTAYFMALLVFYLWPSMGPFYTCPDHMLHFPHWLKTYDFQRTFIANATFMSSQHKRGSQVGTDYFIAFPSLHIALPIIVLWFMRRWKRIVFCLVAYDIVLIPAILLLEWHYVVDLLGGVVVGVIAIIINRSPNGAHYKESIRTRPSADVLKTEPVSSL